MRIVHIALRYPPATGGVETYVRDIVEGTRNVDENRDVRILTTSMRTHGPVSYLEPEELLNDAPYVQRLFVRNTPFVSYPRLQMLDYYIGHHNPDIVETYSFWYQPADVAARYAKKHKKPFIFHPMYYENDVRRKPLWRLYAKTIGRKTFEAADVVVVISPFEKESIQKAGLPVKRFELIPPGLDIEKYDQFRENPFVKRNITGHILLSVGRIAESKGYQDVMSVLPELIKIVPDIQYVIVGEDFGYKEELAEQTIKLGISNHVKFLGKLSDEELVAAYQHCDVFVHPSYYEAFGIVLTEASACRKPIVARNTSAIPYAAPDNVGGRLFSSNQELSKYLVDLLTQQKKRLELGERGRKYVEYNFDQRVVTKRLLELYKRLGPK